MCCSHGMIKWNTYGYLWSLYKINLCTENWYFMYCNSFVDSYMTVRCLSCNDFCPQSVSGLWKWQNFDNILLWVLKYWDKQQTGLQNYWLSYLQDVILWVQSVICVFILLSCHFDGLVQERHNSSSIAMELCLSCINSSICNIIVYLAML